MAEVPKGAQLDPTTALLQAASDALRELGISDPGGRAAAMVFSAALFSPDDARPEISTTRLLLAAILYGHNDDERHSYTGALAAAIDTDLDFNESYRQCAALFHLESHEAALARLAKGWFSPNVQRVLREASEMRDGAPLTDAIVRSLLKLNAGLARSRIDMNRLARRVEAIHGERNQSDPQPTTPTRISKILARLAELRISALPSVSRLLLRAAGYRDKGALEVEHILSALLEPADTDGQTPTYPSTMFRAAAALQSPPTTQTLNLEQPDNPSDPLHFSDSLERILLRAHDLQRSAFLNRRLGTKGLVAALLTLAPSERPGPGTAFSLNLETTATVFRNVLRERLATAPGELQQWNRGLALENTHRAQLNNDQPGHGPPKDMLGITDDARAIAKVAAGNSTSLPLAFGIFGDWGAGKSFFMRLIHEWIGDLVESNATDDGFEHAIVQIQFNAWHYAETNLWASLVGHIFDELDRWMTDEKKGDTKTADQILQRLATSRQLTLEAATELVQRRKEYRKAGHQLEDAEKKLDAAKEAAARAPLNVWRGAIKFAYSQIEGDPELSSQLLAVKEQLGLNKMAEDKDKIIAALSELDRSASAGRAALGGLRATIGNRNTVVLALLGLVAVPLLIFLIEVALSAIMQQPAWNDLAHGFASLGGLLTMLSVLFVEFSKKATGIADKFSKLKDGIDRDISTRTLAEQAEAKAAAEELARSSAEVEKAKTLVHATGEQVAAALKEYAEETGAARIRRFVRARAGVDGYGKHLGLVSTIRKDFEQLESLMLKNEGRPQGDPAKPPEHLEQARLHYEARVKALIREANGRLPDDPPSSAVAPSSGAAKKDEMKAILDSDEVATLLDSTKSLRELKLPPAMEFRRIVLYIDDLDRCEPEKVIEVLQAVNMLLSFRLFVVMVAVDARWLLRSLEVHYPDVLRSLDKAEQETRREAAPTAENGAPASEPGSALPAEDGATVPGGTKGQRDGMRASPADYLEKIFQIPYWVPAMDAASSRALVNDLMAPDRAAGGFDAAPPPPPPPPPPPRGAEAPEPEDQQASTERPQSRALGLTPDETTTLEALAPYLGGSPRRARRFVNVYRVAKTSLTPMEIQKLEAGEHRALATQLAIATGAPNGFSAWLSACGSVAGGPAPHDALETRIRDFTIDNTERSNIHGAWVAFRDMATAAHQKAKSPGLPDPDLFKLLAEQAGRAERFSFAIPDKKPCMPPEPGR